MPQTPLDDDADDTRTEIMQATYRALCKHGYADLTIQNIGDEFEKSKSLLYHHYESKDDLLVEFLAFMLDRFERDFPAETDDDPAIRLLAALRWVLPDTLEGERHDITRAWVELRTQAATNEAFREQFTRSDAFFRDQISSDVRQGIDRGTFRDVDPNAVATFLSTAITGALVHGVTGDDAVTAVVRDELEAYVDCRLRRAGSG